MSVFMPGMWALIIGLTEDESREGSVIHSAHLTSLNTHITPNTLNTTHTHNGPCTGVTQHTHQWLTSVDQEHTAHTHTEHTTGG